MAYMLKQGLDFFSIEVPQPDAQLLRDVLAAERSVTVTEDRLMFGAFVRFTVRGRELAHALKVVDDWARDQHAGEIW